MLEARGLYKWYSGIPVLKGVSFTLETGEVTGYLGPKYTFLNLKIHRSQTRQ